MSDRKRTGLTIRNSTAEFLIFTRQAGEPGIHVRHEDETIWLTQKLVAELFGVTVPTVNEHLKNIFNSGELDEQAVVRKFRTTAADGKQYQTQHYNLDAIISVGYRVNSVRATQFRQWATQVLREFAIKGFVLDRKRLENGVFLGEDFYERLLAEIREIRLSERRFYQKVTDIYATAVDYNPDAPTTRAFFAASPAGHMPIVGMKDIQDGRVRIDPTVRVSLTEREAKPYLLKDGDILINRTNSPDLVGKAGIYRGGERAVFASYLVRLELDLGKVDPDFVIQILAGESGQLHLRKLATRAISQANLNPTTFKNHFPIPLPPIKEQIAVRNVLLAWDSAIQQTEQLMAAKERRLAHLRDTLLRKPERASPVKLCDVTQELTARNGMSLGREAIMAVTKQSGMRPMREETIAASIDRYKRVPPRAFAYNPMRLNIGSIAISPFDHDVLVSPDYVVFACNESRLLPSYLHHLRHSQKWKGHFELAGNGSVRVRIYYDDLGRFTFSLPPIDAQARLVRLLDAASHEIALLKRKADALRAQKRGLMQKLLTGQWRLPLPELETA